MRTTLARLQQHLVHETDLVRAFLTVLEKEQRALSSAATLQDLHVTTARKQALTDQLHAAQQTRTALLTTLGFAQVQQDLAPVVQRYPALRPAIQACVRLLAQARARNQENGTMIEALQAQHRAALTALESLRGAREGHLYNARGVTRTTPAGVLTMPIVAG